jgi:membrane protease YdiL (CAAX protease family)
MFNKPISEIGLAAWLAFSIVFMLLMFDRDFGLIYIAIVVTWFIFFIKDKLFYNKTISFPVERSAQGRGMEVMIGIAGYAVTLLVITFIQSTFNPSALPTGSVVDVLRQISTELYQASTPILRDSIILMVVGWGILIPIAETVLFNGKIFEALYDWLKPRGLITIIVLSSIVGAVAALYHLTSKSGSSTALMITFAFFTISSLVVWWRKDLRAAIIMHVLNNGLAVALPLILK